MLSNTCKYAIRSVIYLALKENGGIKTGIKEISNELKIPSPFLGKILQTLAKHKLLSSTKGPHGGFSLGRAAENISLLDIVEVIDGLEIFNACMIGLGICKKDPEKQKICPVHPVSDKLREEIFELFKNQTIGSIAKDLKKFEGKFDL